MSGPSFLFVRFSAIGDCVMCVPAVSAVRTTHPGAFIVWAVTSRCAPVVDSQRLVDLVSEFPRERWKRGQWSPKTWRDQIRHYLGLRRYRFDFGLDLQGHSKTALCLRLARPARSVSVPATDLFARVLNPRCRTDVTQMHVVEGNLSVLGELGEFVEAPAPIMPDLSAELEAVKDRLPSRPYATITTGAGSADKAYPPEMWASVGRDLRRAGIEVVWLGGPGDPVPDLPDSTDLVAKLTLRESMAAVSAGIVNVAADTGSGHIAAAYGVPCVTVFGPMDPNRYRPYTEMGRVLREGGDPRRVRPELLAEAALELVRGRAEISR